MLCSPRSQMEVSSHSNGTGQARGLQRITRWAAKSQKHITPDLKSNHRTALMSVSLEYCYLPRARSTEVNFGLQNCLSSSAVLTLPTRFIWTCKSPPIQSSIWTIAIKNSFEQSILDFEPFEAPYADAWKQFSCLAEVGELFFPRQIF